MNRRRLRCSVRWRGSCFAPGEVSQWHRSDRLQINNLKAKSQTQSFARNNSSEESISVAVNPSMKHPSPHQVRSGLSGATALPTIRRRTSAVGSVSLFVFSTRHSDYEFRQDETRRQTDQRLYSGIR